MSDNNTVNRQISMGQLKEAIDLVCYRAGATVELPEPTCEWPKLCHENYCRFPRYVRAGEPHGFVAAVLIQLGFPLDVLKELDCEYELGEVLHPGVKISRSRNAALRRIDSRGIALLTYLQDHQKVGWSYNDIAMHAYRSRWMIKFLDRRRRPWLY